MKTHISLSEIDVVKKELKVLLPDVKPSARIEGMARGLGWNSNAHMRAELADGPSDREVDDRPFIAFLARQGFVEVRNGVLTEAVTRMVLERERRAIQQILDFELELGRNGYPYAYKPMTRAERKAELEADRAAMLTDNSVWQFIRAKEFLAQVVRSEKVVRQTNSYGYKHQAEAFQKQRNAKDYYVSNGMFIAAALDMGFKMARIGKSPSVYLNIVPKGEPKKVKVDSKLAVFASGPKREAAWQNMMVAAINAGLDQGLFGLDPTDNRWHGEDHTFRFDLDGLPAIANVRDAGYGELALQVAVNPTARADEAIRAVNAGFYAGDAFGTGLMEREAGKYLQTISYNSFSRALLPRLAALKVEPRGYDKQYRKR